MLEGAFDVAEMSFATFVRAREEGRDLINVPIFTQGQLSSARIDRRRRIVEDRAARAACRKTRRRAAVLDDLVGMASWDPRPAVPGVPASRITWCTAVDERFGGVTFPAGVTIERLEPGVNVETALERGLVDAIAIPPRGVPHPLKPFMRWPYPDVDAAQAAYAAVTGIFPIMHFVVMRATLHARQPELVDALMTAFSAAKPLGLLENARTLSAFLGFARDQGWVLAARLRSPTVSSASEEFRKKR